MLPFTPITDKPPQSPQPPLPGSLFAEPGHQGRGPPSQRLSPGLLLPPQFAGPGRPGAGIGVGELTSDVWQSRPVFGRSSLSCGVGFFVTLLGAGRNSFSDQAEGRERGAGRSRLRPGWGRDSATRGPGARSPEPRARAAADRPLQAAAGSDRPRVPAAGTRSGNTVCSHPGGSAQGRGGPRYHLRSPPPAGWGPGPRVPGSPPRSPRLPPGGHIPGKGPRVSGRSRRLPGEGRLLRRGRASRSAGKVRLRCASSDSGSRARRAPCAAAPARTSSSSARPRRSAALPCSAAPGPAPPSAEMPAPPPRAADLRSLLPAAPGRARWGGGGGEPKSEIKHLDLSLERCQRVQSNYRPRGIFFFFF